MCFHTPRGELTADPERFYKTVFLLFPDATGIRTFQYRTHFRFELQISHHHFKTVRCNFFPRSIRSFTRIVPASFRLAVCHDSGIVSYEREISATVSPGIVRAAPKLNVREKEEREERYANQAKNTSLAFLSMHEFPCRAGPPVFIYVHALAFVVSATYTGRRSNGRVQIRSTGSSRVNAGCRSRQSSMTGVLIVSNGERPVIYDERSAESF